MANAGPMTCPVDGATLVMSERQGIEIDYCPTCRGVWLDRGELDKIIERSAQPAPAPQPVAYFPLGARPVGQKGERGLDGARLLVGRQELGERPLVQLIADLETRADDDLFAEG